MGSKKLTKREESLCQAMLTCGDQSEALRQSLYKTDRMKQATIHQEASKKFSSPRIVNRMVELMATRNKRNDVDADYVLKRLVEIDQLDVLDIIDDEMKLKPLSQWPIGWRRSISGIEVVETKLGNDDSDPISYIKKIRFPDKVKNLSLLGKHVDVNAWADKKVSVDVNVTHNINDVMRRIANERVVSQQ